MIDELRAIALDLTWTWDSRIQALFAELEPQLWDGCAHNPIALLTRLGAEGVELPFGGSKQ